MDDKIQDAAKLLGSVGAKKRWERTSAERKNNFMKRVRAARKLSKKPRKKASGLRRDPDGVPNIKRNTPNAIPSFLQWKQKQAVVQ